MLTIAVHKIVGGFLGSKTSNSLSNDFPGSSGNKLTQRYAPPRHENGRKSASIGQSAMSELTIEVTCFEMSDDENQMLPRSKRVVRCSACPTFKGRRDNWKRHATTDHKVVFEKTKTTKAQRLQQKRDYYHKAKSECLPSPSALLE